MIFNIIDDKRLIEKDQNLFKYIILFTLLVLSIFMVNIFSSNNFEDTYLESTLGFIRYFNSILSILAFGSCLISYSRLRRDDVFVVSLMYLGLAVGIIFGQIDYLTFYYQENSLSNYIIVSTSLLRIILLIIAVIPKSRIKTFIVKYKISSMIFVVLYTILFGILEKKIDFAGLHYSEIFISYNRILTITYIIIAIKLFITAIKEKEYLFAVLGMSISMLALKAIYAIHSATSTSFYTKLTSVSITYIISLIVIGGSFIELCIYINRTKVLNNNLRVFYNFTDNAKHSFMFICNEKGEILYANKKLKESYSSSGDMSKGELNDLFINKIINTGNKDDIMKALEESGIWRGIIKNKDEGSSIDCSIQLIDIIGEEKEIAVSYMDITEAISKEIELEKFKVYHKEKTEFVANISHELRTPLNIFFSTLQLLDRTLSTDDKDFKSVYEKYNKTLHTNCKRMLRLINNVVDMSKIETGILKGNFDNYNLVTIVEDVTLSVLNYAQLKSINIHFETNSEECVIKCDPAMIERAMLNLLSNAIKFSSENKNIYVNIYVNDDYVEINVKDEGIGISKQNRKAIFERFVQVDKSLTRENEGSGIGLSIVKSIVDLHDGYINVESEVNKGSTFKILLPYKNNDHHDCKIYDTDNYSTELELSDIYEVLS